jgi:hypothetical protein
VRVEFTPAERAQAAGNWQRAMAPVYERRTGPRKVPIEADVAPATIWDPTRPASATGPAADRFLRSAGTATPLPSRDVDIAFAPVTLLSRWIESRALTSERLTRL